VISRLLDQLSWGVAKEGVALLEIGAGQGAVVVDLVQERLGGWSCDVVPDLAGLPRVAVLRRTTP
jgi:methylase of polypeptide subunit release factors